MACEMKNPAGGGGARGSTPAGSAAAYRHCTPNPALCQAPVEAIYGLARLLAGASDVDLDALRQHFPDFPGGDGRPDPNAVKEWLNKYPDLAREVLAADPSTPPPALPTTQLSGVPELPDEARLPASAERDASTIGNWLNEYLRYAAQKSPSTPMLFHEAAGLFAGGLAIARRLRVPMAHEDIWPNLYILLVAPTTLYAKSICVRILTDLVDNAVPHLRLACEFTPEALLSDLAGKEPVGLQNNSEDTRNLWLAGRNFAAQRGIILDEASSLFAGFRRDYMTGTSELLLRLYNHPWPYARNTRGAGFVVVRGAALSFLGATTPASLLRADVDALWHTGMFARFALLTPDGDPVYSQTDTRPNPPTRLVETLKRLACELLPVPTYPDLPPVRDVVIDTDAHAAWQRYDKAVRFDLLVSDDAPDGRLWGCYGRMPTQALKIALILAALDWAEGILDTPRITLAHWARGQMIAEKWRASAHRLLAALSAVNPEVELGQRVERLIRRSGSAGLTQREIQRMSGLRRDEIQRALDDLMHDGLITTIERRGRRGPSTVAYCWVGNLS